MLLWATPSATPLALSDTARLEKARSQTHDCDATAKRLHAFRLTQKKKQINDCCYAVRGSPLSARTLVDAGV